jgi:branched-chain amino acid transport system substrate-binding protein
VLRPDIGACAGGSPLRQVSFLVAAAIGTMLAVTVPCASAQQQTAKIAVALPLTGPNASLGGPELDGIRLAIEEANAAGDGPTVQLDVRDDASNIESGKKLAQEIGASDALLVLGPATTLIALEVGRIYSDAGLVNIGPSTTGDEVTEAPNFFRAIASTSDSGELLASYLRHVLNGPKAVVLYKDDSYGRATADGFRRAAPGLGIATEYRAYKTVAESQEAARVAAADPANPAIFIFGYDKDTVPVLTTLRREHAHGPILGTVTMAGEAYSALYASEPEEREKPGFFTDGVCAATPLILDSSNAETLAFADRFRTRFGREPGLWSVQGYEVARLATAAIRATVSNKKDTADLRTRRAAIRRYLLSLDSPANGIPGLNGSLWFTPDRGRNQALRIGRFQNGLFVSAPGQLVPVRRADPAEITSGAVVDLGHGRFMRRQQVVYSGIFLNEISRVDIAQSTFTADFYLWMRFVRGAGAADADPTDIRFPTLVRGNFDASRPSAEGVLDDGTTYRLWQVTGDFKNDFYLQHYPADHKTLVVRFFNARSASDRMVYVQDRRSSGAPLWIARKTPTLASAGGIGASAAAGAHEPEFGDAVTPVAVDTFSSPVASIAFRNLTQWEPVRAEESRDNLVTQSALGDLRLVGLERIRELSGFGFSVEVARRVLATLAKTLLPLALMAMILLASLYFPQALVKEKITVAITAALSGAVLLAAINSQLGNVGYVIAIEYGFYVYFALCLLCIVAVLIAERLRVAGRPEMALTVEQSARYAFVLGLIGTVLAGTIAYAR